MFRVLFFFIISLLAPTFCTYSQTFTHEDTLRGGLTFERTCYDVTYYNLDLAINIEDKSIKGFNEVYFNVLVSTSKIQLDLFKNLIIDSVFLGNQTIPFKRDGNAFFLSFNQLLLRDSSYKIKIYYEGNPIIAKKPPWEGGWVFAEDSLNRPWVAVACEGIGASLWWPLKDHLSDEPDSMRMHFTVPKEFTAVGNGTLESTSLDGQNKTYNWKVNYPINSYNVTCNIAHYEHITDSHIQKNSDTLKIDYYVLDYNKIKAQNHFKQVHPMLSCYEKYFGPYPFFKDGYAMVETPYWGMEHQGAIAYGNNYSNKIIDFDYIIIHESAHEWWGNNISVRDHAEMWIHESFTTYAENLLVECTYGYDMSIRYLNLNKSLIKNETPIVGPLGVNYEGWEDSDMYYKGAWILHTFRNVLKNDSLWFSILKGLQQDLALQTVTTTDVIQYINKSSHQDFTWFFDQYLYSAKPPILEFYLEKHKKKFYLSYRWNNTREDFKMDIPLQFKPSERIYISPTNTFKTLDLPKKGFSKSMLLLDFNYYLLQEVEK
ncbi:M1 family metallopeptidase [uncultured Cytophaga sp.]|uniref:M1 family metallopeptidase n=1 Tax=uncultured Cytophaga sp. TaxID=160238 RepID=UPI00261D2D07|nr:M1 family metallopeptidase [uncultured Cytophaga sp.]